MAVQVEVELAGVRDHPVHYSTCSGQWSSVKRLLKDLATIAARATPFITAQEQSTT
jgi:hypothetical protein